MRKINGIMVGCVVGWVLQACSPSLSAPDEGEAGESSTAVSRGGALNGGGATGKYSASSNATKGGSSSPSSSAMEAAQGGAGNSVSSSSSAGGNVSEVSSSSASGGSSAVESSKPGTGGSNTSGGSSAVGTGGQSVVGAGGASVVPAGGTSSAGGSSARGGTSSVGGSSTVGAGGSSVVSAGGASGGCGDTQANASNCGVCGHSCGGGECVAGMCQPVTVAIVAPSDTTELRAIDGSFLYYSVRPVGTYSLNIERVRKDASSSLGERQTQIGIFNARVALSSPVMNFAVVGGSGVPLSAKQEDSRASCNLANCLNTVSSPTDSSSWLVASENNVQYPATINRACAGATFCVEWWQPTFTGTVNTYKDSSWLPDVTTTAANPQAYRFLNALAMGDNVVWTQEVYNSSHVAQPPALYSIARGASSKMQLAGQLADYEIVALTASSVLLKSPTSKYYYRVPFPQGLGTSAPTPLDIRGTSISEDTTGLYWVDSDGNLGRCLPDKGCASSRTVLAKNQLGATRIMLDEKFIYWSAANPPAIMRLAK